MLWERDMASPDGCLCAAPDLQLTRSQATSLWIVWVLGMVSMNSGRTCKFLIDSLKNQSVSCRLWFAQVQRLSALLQM